MSLKDLKIDSSWTLFLDRDGVINTRIVDGYVTKASDFEFITGVPEALSEVASLFGVIVMVTNQQGIGRGLMTDDDLKDVHAFMLKGITEAGGRIDKVYYCPSKKEWRDTCRKPEVGMALKARKDFPEIHFKKCIMVGDTWSDMLFGKRMGMKTVLVGPDKTVAHKEPEKVDYYYKNLPAFINDIQ